MIRTIATWWICLFAFGAFGVAQSRAPTFLPGTSAISAPVSSSEPGMLPAPGDVVFFGDSTRAVHAPFRVLVDGTIAALPGVINGGVVSCPIEAPWRGSDPDNPVCPPLSDDVQEPATRPKAEPTLLTVGNLGIGTVLPTHKVSIWDERGEVLTADGEIGERLLRALKKHQDTLCAGQSRHDTTDRDLYLRAAILYAELYRDTIDALLETGLVQEKNIEFFKAARLTVTTTIKNFTEIRNLYRKDSK